MSLVAALCCRLSNPLLELPPQKIEFDEDLLEECGNKLDMIQVFADEIDATRVIFAEDMKSYVAHLIANPEFKHPSLEC